VPQVLQLQPYEVVLWGESKDIPLYRVLVHTMSEDEAKQEALWQYKKAAFRHGPAPVTRVEVLSDVHLNTGRRQQTLFEDLADACVGNSMVDVQGAAVNLLLTVVQRNYIKLSDAETRWDELTGRGREALRRRFTGETDNRDKAVETEIARRLGA
jgi:hypothetical protein